MFAHLNKICSKAIFFALLFFAFQANVFGQEIPDTLKRSEPDSLLDQTNRTPVFTLTAGELDNDSESQDISGLLQSSRDVFAAVAGFNFSQGRYRIRGYNSDNTLVLLNGIKVNDPESGWASWSSWGGLNDVTRYPEVRIGISPSSKTFGGMGGYTAIETRASKFAKGNRISYAYSNRSYNHRLMATGSTGLMKNGVAVTASVSRRYSTEGFVEGTFFDSYSYFLAIEKRFNDRHAINFTGFGAPVRQGRQGVSFQEANDLAGTNFYNPYWGYQNGEKRNSRVSDIHRPMFILNHYFTLNQKTQIQSAAFLTFGKNGLTGLNWYDAKDPRPDYYRYLPSYFTNDDAMAAQVTQNWMNDVNTRQINWDQLYFANTKNLFQVENADGISGNTVVGNRSKYILEEYRNDLLRFGLNGLIEHQYSEKIKFSGGLYLARHRTRNHKVMHDLLGGDFWVDIEQFAEQLSEESIEAQNDLQTTNRIIEVGESFGYDYYLHVDNADAFAQVEYSSSKFDVYAALTGSFTSFWREGNYQNGRFPNNSLGDSEKNNFTNGGVKAGVVYKISGRHYVTANAMFRTQAPDVRFAYVSPRTRDFTVPGLTSEKLLSGDINYLVRYPNFKARVTGFYSSINDQVWLRNFYHEELRTFVNYSLSNVDHLFVGTELGVEYKFLSAFTLTAAFATGQFIWNSRPTGIVTSDNSSEILAENEVSYMKNYRIGGMPQTVLGGGLRYNGAKYWFIGVNANYYDDIFIDPNPVRRTESAVEGFVDTDPQVADLLTQEQMESAFTMDAYVGKSFRIKGKYLNLNFSANNILNKRDFRVGGFEQLRFDPDNLDRFPPKYYYHFGTTFFVMATLRF